VAQTPATENPSKTLVLKSRVPSNVTIYAARNFGLPSACDALGRPFVKLMQPGPGMIGPLYRLSNKGVLEAEFDTSGAIGNIYAVRPGGGVAMVRSDGFTRAIDNFGPDGKFESTIWLERPPIGFFPTQIAVFPTGEILMSGLQGHPGYRTSTAIYHPAGHLIKQFVLPGDAEVERGIESGNPQSASLVQSQKKAVSRSVAVNGDDGLVYLMRGASPAPVYAISATGEVMRQLSVAVPTPTGLPQAIRVAKNRLAMSFYPDCDPQATSLSCHGMGYTVVNATTGQRLANYVTTDEDHGLMACYAPDPDRFLLVSTPVGERRLEIINVAEK
jgi:hypothetical protein